PGELIGGPRLDYVLVCSDDSDVHYKSGSGVVDLNGRTRAVNRSLKIPALVHRHVAGIVGGLISKGSARASFDKGITSDDQTDAGAVDLGDLLRVSSRLIAQLPEPLDLILLLFDRLLILISAFLYSVDLIGKAIGLVCVSNQRDQTERKRNKRNRD